MPRPTPWILLIAVLALAIASACGDDADVAPTATPPPTTGPTPTSEPVETPDLAATALRLDDLPEGFEQTGEDLLDDAAAGIEFSRVFEPDEELGFVTVGSSFVGRIESNVIFFRGETDATVFMADARSTLRGDAGAIFLADVFLQQGLSGVEVTMAERDLGLGDENLGITGFISSDEGDIAITFFIIRIGQAVSQLIIVGGEEFDPADVRPFAGIVAARLREAHP